MKIKTAYIEITNRCNLNCRTCYNRSGQNRTTQEISVENLAKLMDRLSQYGANRFLLSGGEPSLHSQFHKILDLLDQYPNRSFGIVTNGTNHDPHLINYLNTHQNTTLQISLDGAAEEQNALTRGPGNFERTITFAKKITNCNISRLLKMVISQCNLDGVEHFYQLALSLGFTPEFTFIYRSGNGSDAWENKALSAQQKLKVLKTIEELNQKHGIDAFLPLCTSTCPFVSTTENMSVCIKTDGSIQPCQSLYSSEFTLGNIFSFSEEQILSNLERIVSIAQKRANTDYNCSKCLLKDVCGRGCMAEAFNLTSNPLASDESCLYRKLQFLHCKIKKQ